MNKESLEILKKAKDNVSNFDIYSIGLKLFYQLKNKGFCDEQESIFQMCNYKFLGSDSELKPKFFEICDFLVKYFYIKIVANWKNESEEFKNKYELLRKELINVVSSKDKHASYFFLDKYLIKEKSLNEIMLFEKKYLPILETNKSDLIDTFIRFKGTESPSHENVNNLIECSLFMSFPNENTVLVLQKFLKYLANNNIISKDEINFRIFLPYVHSRNYNLIVDTTYEQMPNIVKLLKTFRASNRELFYNEKVQQNLNISKCNYLLPIDDFVLFGDLNSNFKHIFNKASNFFENRAKALNQIYYSMVYSINLELRNIAINEKSDNQIVMKEIIKNNVAKYIQDLKNDNKGLLIKNLYVNKKMNQLSKLLEGDIFGLIRNGDLLKKIDLDENFYYAGMTDENYFKLRVNLFEKFIGYYGFTDKIINVKFSNGCVKYIFDMFDISYDLPSFSKETFTELLNFEKLGIDNSNVENKDVISTKNCKLNVELDDIKQSE